MVDRAFAIRSAYPVLYGLAAAWIFFCPAPASGEQPAGAVHAPAAPVTIAVRVSGSVPGADRAALERYCVERMTALQLAGWRFAPAADDAPAANSIDFHFVLNAYGGGTTRYIGPIRSTVDQLFGLRRSISVEAKLFLDGQYETLSFSQGQVQGGAHDPALGDLIARLTHALIVSADTIGPGSTPHQAG